MSKPGCSESRLLVLHNIIDVTPDVRCICYLCMAAVMFTCHAASVLRLYAVHLCSDYVIAVVGGSLMPVISSHYIESHLSCFVVTFYCWNGTLIIQIRVCVWRGVVAAA